MKMTLGPFEIPADLPERLQKQLLDLTLRDLQDAIQGIKPSRLIEPHETPSDEGIGDLALLKASGFTDHTIVMLARKLLHVQCKTSNLAEKLPEIHRAVTAWAERDLKKDQIWAMYLEPFEIPKRNETLFASLGLNSENQMIILDVGKEGSIERLSQRGLNTKKIEVLMLDSLSSVKLPNIPIQLDWLKYIAQAKTEKAKRQLEEIMYMSDPKTAKKELSKLGAPKELLTYYNFDKTLWRALRAATGIQRIERELRSKLKLKLLRTPEQRDFITAFALLRLQYHWLKIPVDSENLNNMKYIKMRLSEV